MGKKRETYPSVEDFVQQDEEEQDPDLRVAKGLLDLRPLDGLVVHTSPVGLASGDQEGFVLQCEACCGHDVVRQEPLEQHAPDNRHASAKQEDDPPHGEIALVLANGIEEDSADSASDSVEAVEDACP